MHNDLLTLERVDAPVKSSPRLPGDARRAVALVIVLSFLVLITGVVLAFFSLSALQHQVSHSSASLTSAELFARGALNATVGDLQQEIVDGSNTPVPIPTPSPSPWPVIYLPKTAANAEPALAGTTGASGTENLLKRSARNTPFYPNGVTRAAASSTTGTSVNGRSVPLARWNKPLLLGKATPGSSTDLTPVGAFTAPDWVLVNNARVGDDGATAGNPTTWNPNMIWSNAASNKTAVVGRYAYTIYDEGGLLDANVAGYPAPTGPNSSTGTNYINKNAEAFADLTQLGLTQAQINALIGWRNNATMSASGSLPTYSMDLTAAGGQLNYRNFILGNTNGFLSTASTTVGSSSDTTDHQFGSRQSLIQFLVNGVGQSGGTTPGLQNVLQYLGTFTRGVNAPTYTPSASRTLVITSGRPNDNDFNPGTINDARVFKTFTRASDGTAAQVGEPLIKYRFSLSHLALFGDNNDKTADTSSDIYKYFGLTRSSPSDAWQYDHGKSGKIMTLSDVASTNFVGTPREPDFFELLQAGMTFGSLGQTLNNSMADVSNVDTYTYNQVLQTGANLMDQYDADSFPTTIVLHARPGDPTSDQYVYGIECLPYLTQVFNLVWRKDITQGPRYWYQPAVWNPQNTLSTAAGPTNFRFIVTLSGYPQLYIHYVSQGGYQVDSATTSLANPTGITFTPSPANNYFNLPTILTSNPNVGASATGNDVVNDQKGSLGIFVGFCPIPEPTGTVANPTPGGPPIPDTWVNALDYYSRASEGSYLLQYLDGGNHWVTYDQMRNQFGALGQYSFGGMDYLKPTVHQYQTVRGDPRCDRFGLTGSLGWGGDTVDHPNPTTPRMNQADQGSTAIYASAGWSPTPGWTFNNSGGPNGRSYFYPGALSDNLTSSSSYYADPDGVVRPGMGAYTGGNGGSLASGGYPQADDSGTTFYNIRNSRPLMLNRPFRSVADMGYASRGEPWKNVDFFHTSSGDAALLDLFCVDPTPELLQKQGYANLNTAQTAVPLHAGALDLNTRQTPVIQALLNGAIKQEASYTPQAAAGGSTPTVPSDLIGSADMGPLASSLTALTAATPLVNRSELVTKWQPKLTYGAPKDNNLKTCRESAIRALADVGNTRTWNLLIDLIAQTGRYPANAGKLDQFNVEGERRYWLHVAIDRYTGKVVSQSLEPVYE